MVTKIGKKVKKFYNETPFPDYELKRFEDKEDLKMAAYPFARVIDRSIPINSTVIDIGTGTGQLSAFLSLRRNCVYGIDFSESSLNKAKKLKEKLGLKSLHLKRLDILNEKQINSIGIKFDYVLCLGVLHHTGNACKAFKNILKLVRPGGYIAIGLYNKFGRIPLQIRRILVKTIFKNNQRVKDYFIRIQIGDIKDKERVGGWWKDQYLHPHETAHSIGEVLKWFKKNGVEYYQTVPSSTILDSKDIEIAGLWNNFGEVYPHFLVRIWKQLLWIFKTQKEGGYWITFGRLKK